MKIEELEDAIRNLSQVKAISDVQNYNVSTSINKNLMPVINLLKSEYDRMTSDKIDINCPGIEVFDIKEVSSQYEDDNLNFENQLHSLITKAINSKIKDLVLQGYKIIDFGYTGTATSQLGYIKYTD